MTDRVIRPHWGWFVLLDGGLILCAVLAFSEPLYERFHSIFPIPGGQGLMVFFLVFSAFAHGGEAIYSYRLAKKIGLHQSAGGWFLQTLVVGFPSTLLIRKLAQDRVT